MRCVTDVLPVIRTRFGEGNKTHKAHLESHSNPLVGWNVTPHTLQGICGTRDKKSEFIFEFAFGGPAPPSGLTLWVGGSPGGSPLVRSHPCTELHI